MSSFPKEIRLAGHDGIFWDDKVVGVSVQHRGVSGDHSASFDLDLSPAVMIHYGH